MKSKISITIAAIFLTQFISSCCKEVKYYDFTQMTIQLSSNTLQPNERLAINLVATDVEYLSSNFMELGFGTALAFDCDDGWGGMKYPFQKIEITSSADFNADHLAGEDLLDLFLIRRFVGNGEFEFVNSNDLDLQKLAGQDIELALDEAPEMASTHTFKISLTKSNGEVIIVETGAINWP